VIAKEEVGYMSLSTSAEFNYFKLGEIDFYYQPQISTFTGNIVKLRSAMFLHGYEITRSDALFHFAHNNDSFITAVGNLNIQHVCEQLSQWQTQKQLVIPVSIIVRQQQILSGTLLSTVTDSLSKERLPAKWLEFEFQEDCIYQRNVTFRNTLHTLHELGITITLSGFGTDLFAYRYIRRLPIDSVVIHECFVNEIGRCKKAEELIQKMAITFAENNIRFCAPKVQSIKQELFLASVGCQIIQSAYPPIRAEQVSSLLRDTPNQ